MLRRLMALVLVVGCSGCAGADAPLTPTMHVLGPLSSGGVFEVRVGDTIYADLEPSQRGVWRVTALDTAIVQETSCSVYIFPNVWGNPEVAIPPGTIDRCTFAARAPGFTVLELHPSGCGACPVWTADITVVP